MSSPRPRDLGTEAKNTLSEYQEGLREAELINRLEGDAAAEPPAATPPNVGRLLVVALLWAIPVLAIAGAAMWLLDRVVGAEAVAVFTTIVLVAISSRTRRVSYKDVERPG